MKNQKTNKIVFLVDSVSQPRCLKRIRSFISHGYEVEVYGFNRNKYNQNTIIDDINIHIIGTQHDGEKYISKFFQVLKLINTIKKKYPYQHTLFYSFGFIQTFLLKIKGLPYYIYEISDILYGYNKFKKIAWLFRSIDKFLIKNSQLTVLTSDGFSKYLFKNNIPSNIVVQPNKLDKYFSKLNRPKNNFFKKNKLVFSYIGAFRYPNTIFRFAKIIGGKYPNHEFHFYGDSYLTSEVEKICSNYANVKLFGPFKNPKDLESIYSSINIVVACYDTKDLNERIAEPNKLYEALFFNKPIIVSKDTFLEQKVNKMGCGYSLDASKDETIMAFVESINVSGLQEISNNISKISSKKIIDDNAKRIIENIKTIL